MATELKGSVSKGITDTIIVLILFETYFRNTKTSGLEIKVPARDDNFESVAINETFHYNDTLY